MLLWAYRGEVSIRVGTRDQRLVCGGAIWAPARVSLQVESVAESILLPLGQTHGRVRIGIYDLRLFSFCCTPRSPHTRSYAPTPPPRIADELFQEQFLRTDPAGTALTGAVGVIATALRRAPADSRSLAGWANRSAPRLLCWAGSPPPRRVQASRPGGRGYG